MTPETDILIPAVLPLKDRCSLNFHFWPPCPWDPCYFHLRESVFFLSLPPCVLLFPLPPYSLQREQARKTHTELQLFNQSLPLHILISYFQAISRRPTTASRQLQKILLYYTNLQQEKNIYWNLYSASAKRTPFYTDPVMHTNQSRLWKSNWKHLPYYYLCMGNTDFLSMTKRLLCDILTSKT